MKFRVSNVFFVVTFVVCRSAFAIADGDVDVHVNVHQRRRLPITNALGNDAVKGISNAVRSSDETTSAVPKALKALDDKAAASANIPGMAKSATKKSAKWKDVTKDDVLLLRRSLSEWSPKRKSLMTEVLLWFGGTLLGLTLLTVALTLILTHR